MEHTVKFCTVSEYKRWRDGEVVYHPETKAFIPIQDVKSKEIFQKDDYRSLYFDKEGKPDDFSKVMLKQRKYRKSHPYYGQDAYAVYGSSDDRQGYFYDYGIIDGIELIAFGEF